MCDFVRLTITLFAAVLILSVASADEIVADQKLTPSDDTAVTEQPRTDEADNHQLTDAELATEHMVGVFYAFKADRAERALQDVGLAQPEIEDAVDEFAKGYADCVVSSLEKTNNLESTYVIEMLANGEDMVDVGRFIDSLTIPDRSDPLEVFDYEAHACVHSLDANYGLN